MEKKSKEALARKRAAVILKVRSGAMTATDGAKALGISRKSYYVWERRALEALMETLEERPSGRPLQETDPEEKKREEKIRTLEQENEILRARVEIQELMMQMQCENKKKQRKKKQKKS